MSCCGASCFCCYRWEREFRLELPNDWCPPTIELYKRVSSICIEISLPAPFPPESKKKEPQKKHFDFKKKTKKKTCILKSISDLIWEKQNRRARTSRYQQRQEKKRPLWWWWSNAASKTESFFVVDVGVVAGFYVYESKRDNPCQGAGNSSTPRIHLYSKEEEEEEEEKRKFKLIDWIFGEPLNAWE